MDNLTIKVLLVEDDEDDYRLTRKLLTDIKSSRFDLEWAQTYTTALEALRHNGHEVCLVDYHLGEHNGLEVIRDAQSIGCRVPMILLTGQGDHEVDVEAMRAGAADYLSKWQLSSDMLERSIRYAIERGRAEEALRKSAEQFRTLFENAPIGIYRTTPDGRILMANPTLLRMLECASFAELALRNLEGEGFEPTYLRSQFKERLEREGEVKGLESSWRRRNGSVVFIRENVRAVSDDAGTILYYEGTVEDITERKQEEEALKVQARVLESMAEGVNLSDESGIILYTNPAEDAMFGYDKGDLIGEHVAVLNGYQPEENASIVNEVIEQLKIQGSWLGEFINRRKDGTLFCTSARITALDISNKKYWVCVQEDITERKRSEQRLSVQYTSTRILAESTRLNDAGPRILQAIGEGLKWEIGLIWSFDDDSGVLRCIEIWHGPSVRITEFEALSRETTFAPGVGLPGRVWKSGEPIWITDVMRDANFPRGLIAAQQGLHGAFGFPILLKEKVLGVIEFFSHSVRQPDAEVLNLMATIGSQIGQFIKRKRAEAALRESEERYRIVAETATDAIITIDEESTILFVNSAVEKIFGYAPQEVLGQSLTLLLPDHLQHLDQAGLKEYIKTSQGHISWEAVELPGLHKNGHEIPLEISFGESSQKGKHLFTGIIRDITERKHAEKALRDSEEQLRQSQKIEAIGQLAGGVAHDFNNLLTAITGYSDLSLRRLDPRDPLRLHIQEIKKAAERAASLTRQLLAFSRKQVLQPKVLDLNLVIKDINKMLRRLIGEDIELLTVLEPTLGQIKADPGQIEQVIMNLAVNARDAMPRGGKLTIETKHVYLDEAYARYHIAARPGYYVMMAVSDTGCGMDAETQARIFEPFFTTKEQGKGTGLGLSTVYGIIKQSGGNIWVYSEVGEGTTFKIYLPRVDEVGEVNEAQGRAPAEMPVGCETVLLVEDEALVRQMARQILQMNGYQVLEAHGGEEALLVCERHRGRIDLMVTDVVMPQMGGRDLAEQLQSLRPETRVLYISGYTDDAIVHHGVLDPGTPFLEKPFTPNALACKVREVLSAPQKIS